MTYQGHFVNNMIILDDAVNVPDGVSVRVEFLSNPVSEVPAEEVPIDVPEPTLYDSLKEFIGAATGLPEDFAAEHDHYIHGTPKRSENYSPRTIAERLENVIGKGTGLPSDFAENHDHYIHGAPKE